MYSTDHNLNNPTRKISIDLLREVSSWKAPTVMTIAQNFYDLLETKDPNTIYVIIDSPKRKMYIGDHMIVHDGVRQSYLIGQGEKPNEYILYSRSTVNWNDVIVEICKFDDPQKALNAMSIYNHAGSHSTIDLEIYTMLNQYIEENISVHDLIIGCFISFGFKEDPRIQDITQKCISFGKPDKDLPPMFRRELRGFRDRKVNALFTQYSELYDIIVKYDFFNDLKYHDPAELPDLADTVKDINKVFNWF